MVRTEALVSTWTTDYILLPLSVILRVFAFLFATYLCSIELEINNRNLFGIRIGNEA